MSKFDEVYDIRKASKDEIRDVMEFIDTYWKKGHILGSNVAFFTYEHVLENEVTFIIAKKWEDGKIEGILGFLPASSDKDNLDIWGVMWKTLPEAVPMLGMELKKRVVQITGARSELGTGADPNTSVPLLRMILRYHVHKMKQYYMLADREEYLIAKIVDKKIKQPICYKEISYKKCVSVSDIELDLSLFKKQIPYKDSWYLNKRFFQHPIYQYNVFQIYEKNIPVAIIVTREQASNKGTVLRIVDYIGDEHILGKMGVFFSELLSRYEYIDFYEYGLEDKNMEAAGFVLREDNDNNIIPNYFQPFLQKNIDVWVDSSVEGAVFFKADGDQDRPS